MDDFARLPRDQKAAWTSYDMAPHNSRPSSRESWSRHSQPYDYRTSSNGYSGTSHRRNQDSVNGSQHHQLPLIRYNHDFLLFDDKPSSVAYPVSSESQRGHRQVTRMAHNDQDTVASSIAHSRSHRESGYATSKSSKNGDVSDEVWHRSSHKDRYQVPVPPKAPRIPRLPTPDFDDMDYSEFDLSNHQFCACCGKNGGFGGESRRGECTAAKMGRRVLEAKAYIAYKDKQAR
ncbi:uncharacterized protein F4812DRAFT_462888 [Daldinia caldariorum]|uniref:uncharacterized protein n=1 Tax=Daldinia caldariorum TaxID=326644 RepID=UPI0020082200|nr:uncharacterized protein F4812DRAFT_462888 [Daldinia caldariorum]KAI1464138.1 hypothetical protein F4812DRAFT_462888 [Daldinia caldariorum]